MAAEHVERTAVLAMWLVFYLWTGQAFASSPVQSRLRSAAEVAQCKGVTLDGAYLAEENPGQGPGFLVTLRNLTDSPVTIVDPPPLSVHWYAEVKGRWLWRASSGSGGSFVNALHESGPLFAQQLPSAPVRTRSIPAAGVYSWAVFSGSNTDLAYDPGCERCSYSGEARYRAVLAYAVLSPANDQGKLLLRCGLRSNPIVMPDFQSAHKAEHQGVR